jgi:uncharacterized membrane protein HdeD (DUF308 family)
MTTPGLPDVETLRRQIKDAIKTHSKMFMFEGVVLILFGLMAIALPVVSTLTIGLIVGAALLVGGVVQVVSSFKHSRESGFWLSLVVGALAAIVGLLFLFDPSSGALSLTLLLIALFLAEGVTKIVAAIQMRDVLPNWGWTLVSGLISVVLAGILWSGFPITAAWVLGLLVGINMVFFGVTLIVMAASAKKL